MTVEQRESVDTVAVGNDEAILVISDHLEWADENQHLNSLQNKLNFYIAVVNSGQIEDTYPDTRRKPFVILVDCIYRPDADGRRFLSWARDRLSDLGIELRVAMDGDRIELLPRGDGRA